MSLFVPSWIGNTKPELIFNAAKIWRDRCLLDNKSVFTDKKLWSTENFTVHLQEHYIKKLKKGGFFDTIKPVPPELQQLIAEIYWMMMLLPFTNKIGGSSMISCVKKISNIKEIWKWSGEDFPPKDLLNEKGLLDCLKRGIASVGTLSFYYRPGLFFSIIWLQHWKSKSQEKQQDLINNHEQFAKDMQEWENTHYEKALKDVRERGFRVNKNHVMRNTILYLLFPEYFESVLCREDRKNIIAEFSEEENWSRSNWEDDKLLLEIRQEEEKRRQSEGRGKGFHFYDKEYREKWDDDWNKKQ